MFEKSKNFSNLVGISALLIAFSAAFFSVFGLSKLFAGAELSVIIMASSLEFGKLVAASFLYRYWDKINLLQKFYMTFATVVLVIITSAGIFGFLSNAYQGATVNFEKQSTELLALEDRLDVLQEDRVFLKQELEDQVLSLPENYITAKRNLREQYNPQIQEISTEILEVKGRISDLEIELIETGVDVGPAIYLAKAFETDVDTVVKFFIFILIFVFDPLAVMLVIAYNQALIDRSKEKQTLPDTPGGSYNKPASQPILIEDNERMDIIGQNGNDGLHYDITDQDLIDDSDVEPREENDPRPLDNDSIPTAKGGVKIR